MRLKENAELETLEEYSLVFRFPSQTNFLVMTVTATTTADDPTTTVADDFTVYDDVTSTVTTTTTIVTEVDYPTDAASVGGYPLGSASTPTAPPSDSRYNYHKRHCTLSNFGADR